MILSASTQNIFAAFAKFRGECPPVKKNRTVKVTTRTGGSYEFTYADLQAIEEAVTPALAKHELGFTQLLGATGEVTTLIVHSSGEYFGATSNLPGVPGGSTKQDAGGNITYLRRYSLASILGVVAEDDMDAEPAAVEKVSAKKPVQKAAKPQEQDPIANPTPKMTPDIERAMVAAVRRGEYDKVIARLDAYDISLAKRTELKQVFDAEKKKLEGGANTDSKKGDQ